MATYVTTQGDTFDSIAFKLYGNERYMKDLIEANWRQAETLVFSDGIELTVPEITQKSTSENTPFWREETEQGDTVYENEGSPYDDDTEDDEDSEDLTDYESEDEDGEE